MANGSATFVVVGGGIAVVSCIEQLAELCPNEPVVVLTASHLVKTVSNLQKVGYAMESFDVEEKAAESVFHAFPNVTVVACYCTGIDSEKMEVYTSIGETFTYKKLCLAAGGRPKLLSDNPFVIGIRDTDSVRTFQSRLKNCRRMAVVGNGGIATELVYEVQKVQVIWVVKHKNVSATFVDAGAAEFFVSNNNSKRPEAITDSVIFTPKKRLKYTHANVSNADFSSSNQAPGSALGPDWVEDLAIVGAAGERQMTIEYESEIAKIMTPSEFIEWKRNFADQYSQEQENWPVFILLTSGKVYGCDLIVSATGVIPNSAAFVSEKCQLKVGADGGILVDDEMKTSVMNIYAAGDICTANWSLASHWFQMRLWTQARQMGAFAGRCMALHFTNPGSRVDLDICFEIFTHVTKFFGFKVVLLGLFNSQKLGANCEALLRVKKGKNTDMITISGAACGIGDEYVKVIISDNRVQGAMLIGETDLEETMENLILNQTDISAIKDDLLNPTVDIEDYFD